MYIIEVIPFAKAIRAESLTYFYSESITPGKLVTVPLRKKEVTALVLSAEPAKNNRSALKQKDFAIKKVIRVLPKELLQPAFIQACITSAAYHATGAGAILQSMIPAAILEDLTKAQPITPPKKLSTSAEIPERYVLQEPLTDRLGTYRKIIRTTFAQKKSVVVVCPTEIDCEQRINELSKGIESSTFLLTSSLTKKKIVSTWNKCITHQKQLLIITTPKFAAVPRGDIGAIIIDKESSGSYISQQRPYTDMRIVLEQYAALLDAKLYLADIALRAELLLRFDQGDFNEEGSLKFRNVSAIKAELIDMKKGAAVVSKQTSEEFEDDKVESETKKEIAEPYPFTILSKKVREDIQSSKRALSFLYVARKGLASTISCTDCGTLVSCQECSAPMVLYGKKNIKSENAQFRCNQCGTSRSALEACNYCDGWRLQQLGIGVEAVAKEAAKLFPDRTIIIVDGDHTKTHVQAKKAMATFYETEGALLIGTEMAPHYLYDVVPHIHVITIDSLFALPHYAIREKIMRTLLTLQSKATSSFIIQSRMTDDPLFKNFQQGMLMEFYRDEFKARKQFDYPPFSVLIKISIAGTVAATTASISDIFEQLKQADSEVAKQSIMYSSPYSIHNKTFRHILIKSSHEAWPQKNIVRILQNLPPQYKVTINPQQLF